MLLNARHKFALVIFRLDERLIFPDADLAEPDGLLAVGGDLSVRRLMLAYQNGIFPWFSDDMPILWYAPHERCVLDPARLKISKSMRKVLRSGQFNMTKDLCFEQVIRACADSPREGQDGTWINADMISAYQQLHIEGYAHSVEVWMGDELVGALYGVAVGSVFCGESMFSKVSNASKAALIALCQSGRYELIDCQLPTDHLISLGASMLPRQDYISILHRQQL